MNLFTAFCRTDDEFLRSSETWFEFLDRIDDLAFGRVRTLFDTWFSRIPESKAIRLRKDFLAKRDEQVEAAFFEVFMHAALVRTPLYVVIEPGRSEGPQPDFRCSVSKTASDDFLLEARVVGDPLSWRARERRLKAAFEAVNQARPPGFSIFLRIIREGSATPSGSELRERILPWLESLDRATLRSNVESGETVQLPERDFTIGEWIFRVRAWPLSNDALSNLPKHRLIGIEPARTAWGGSTSAFQAGLKKKKAKYELEERPYVIALGNTHTFQSPDDALTVLYGQEAVQILGETASGDLRTRLVRRPNGLFRPDRNRRVSAVLLVPRFAPWSIASLQPELWRNPFAAQPLPGGFPWAAEVALLGATISRRSARVPMTKLFELSQAWPGPEKPFADRFHAE